MSELIAIREAARRLGVSDTAVRKAITAGRVTVAGHRETNGRPLLSWPECEQQWHANSDASKRTHVGPTGTSPTRNKYAGTGPVLPVTVEAKPQPIAQPAKDEGTELDAEGDVAIHDGMTLTEAKTAKAIYDARKARMDYEEATGVLVRAEEVRSKVFKMARAARDELTTMEDRLSPILASLTDLNDVRKLLRDETRRICERIASASDGL